MAQLKDFFEPFLQYKISIGQIPNTIIGYRRLLKCLDPIKEREISELKKNDDGLIRIEGRKHGVFGEQKAIVLFRSILRFIEDEGTVIPFNYERIEVPHPQQESKEQHHLTPTEFENFVEKIPNTFNGKRDRALYELLWATGCRIGEALAIQIKDIDWEAEDGPEIFVNTEKGGDGNKVYISDRLQYWLKTWIEYKPLHDDLFINFNHMTGDMVRLSVNIADGNLARYRKKLGITRKLEHPSFRRGFGTNAIENGATIREVQHLMRHKSERTTLREYIKFDKKKVKQVHNRIMSRPPKTEMVQVVNNIINRSTQENE